MTVPYYRHTAGRRLDSHHDAKPSPLRGSCSVCRFATTDSSSGLPLQHNPTTAQLPAVDAWLAAQDDVDAEEAGDA